MVPEKSISHHHYGNAPARQPPVWPTFWGLSGFLLLVTQLNSLRLRRISGSKFPCQLCYMVHGAPRGSHQNNALDLQTACARSSILSYKL